MQGSARKVSSLEAHVFCQHGEGNPMAILASIGNGGIIHDMDNAATVAGQRAAGTVALALADALSAFMGEA